MNIGTQNNNFRPNFGRVYDTNSPDIELYAPKLITKADMCKDVINFGKC